MSAEFLELPPGIDPKADEPGLFKAYMGWPFDMVRTVKIIGSDRVTGTVLVEDVKTRHREWTGRLGLSPLTSDKA